MGEAVPDDIQIPINSDEDNDDSVFHQFSVTEIFKEKDEQLIERAPDKMIDYFDGFIMLAFRGVVVYVDVTEHKIDKETSHEMIEHTISEESNLIKRLDLNRRYKIICI